MTGSLWRSNCLACQCKPELGNSTSAVVFYFLGNRLGHTVRVCVFKVAFKLAWNLTLFKPEVASLSDLDRLRSLPVLSGQPLSDHRICGCGPHRAKVTPRDPPAPATQAVAPH
jgi:hypothetical protein